MKCSQCKYDGIKYIFKEKGYKRYCYLEEKIIKNYPYPKWCTFNKRKKAKEVNIMIRDVKSGVVRKGIVRKGSIGNKRGWAFDVVFNDRKYPNVISALYKTKKETEEKLNDYFENDKLDTYGSAE